MAHVYSNNELVDMIMVYGEAQGNAEEASRIYANKFPNRFHPAPRRFFNVTQRARDTGELQPHYGRDGGPDRLQRILNAEEQVLQLVAEDPSRSTRSIGRQLRVSNRVVWRTLNEDLQHPYHFQRVQALNPDDPERRIEFCQWILQQNEANPNFVDEILFTDECTFTRNGIFNFHNYHQWSAENPHAIRRTNFQQRFSINFWGGIVNGCLLGLYELPQRMNGLEYLNFLQHGLEPLVDDVVPLAIRQRMFFMHDGAPCHYLEAVRAFLDHEFPYRWIGRGGPIAWPPRSPDLNPMDFYVWGFLKNLIYRPGLPEVQDVNELRQRVHEATEQLREGGAMRQACQSLLRRARLCLNCNGGNFEHLL